jgi:hypothetical protein
MKTVDGTSRPAVVRSPPCSKARLSADQLDPGFTERALAGAPETLDHVPLPVPHVSQIHLHSPGGIAPAHAVVVGPARQVRNAGAGDDGLGWGAPLVDAGAADVLPFDERQPASGARERAGERATALPRADHHQVVRRALASPSVGRSGPFVSRVILMSCGLVRCRSDATAMAAAYPSRVQRITRSAWPAAA